MWYHFDLDIVDELEFDRTLLGGWHRVRRYGMALIEEERVVAVIGFILVVFRIKRGHVVEIKRPRPMSPRRICKIEVFHADGVGRRSKADFSLVQKMME